MAIEKLDNDGFHKRAPRLLVTENECLTRGVLSIATILNMHGLQRSVSVWLQHFFFLRRWHLLHTKRGSALTTAKTFLFTWQALCPAFLTKAAAWDVISKPSQFSLTAPFTSQLQKKCKKTFFCGSQNESAQYTWHRTAKRNPSITQSHGICTNLDGYCAN